MKIIILSNYYCTKKNQAKQKNQTKLEKPNLTGFCHKKPNWIKIDRFELDSVFFFIKNLIFKMNEFFFSSQTQIIKCGQKKNLVYLI